MVRKPLKKKSANKSAKAKPVKKPAAKAKRGDLKFPIAKPAAKRKVAKPLTRKQAITKTNELKEGAKLIKSVESQLTPEQQSDMTRRLKKLSHSLAIGKAGKGNGQPAGRGDGQVETRWGQHGVVDALAGTGKTFTMVLAVAYTFRKTMVRQTDYTGTLWGYVRQRLGFMPEPSDQQLAVWEFIANGGPTPQSIRYIAFNSAIVQEFEAKYSWLVNALRGVQIDFSFSTVHSLGNAACRNAYNLKGWSSVDKRKVQALLSAVWGVDLAEVWREKAELIGGIEELVGLHKLTLTEATPDKMEQLADHYGILSNGDRTEMYKAVPVILKMCQGVDIGDKIDFNDQVWLPVVNKLAVQQFDLLLGDEAQDWNRCQQEVILKAGRRIVLVGDVNQAIYGFAGADIDSIPRMSKLLGAGDSGRNGKQYTQESGAPVTLPLTVTRRCGRAIVEEARKFVESFEAHPNNSEGLVRRIGSGSFLGEVGEKDMVLCRVNAPLVGYAFKLLRGGKKANIVGRDIGDNLKYLIKKSGCKDAGDFGEWLDGYYQRESERLAKRKRPDPEAMVTLQDRVECLRVFIEGAITVKDMYRSIDDVFRGKQCPKCKRKYNEKQTECYGCKEADNRTQVKLVKPEGTQFSSIHRAKGLEAGRVFILRPDLMPHPMATSQWEKGQERNLQYVAITRAINELVYVDKGSDVEDISDE